MTASEWVHLDFLVIVRETEKAFFIRFDMTSQARWIPKSMVADADEYDAGDRNGTISVKEWFRNKLLEEEKDDRTDS